MGNGRAVLILDVPGFAVHAHVLSDARPANAAADRMLDAGGANAEQSLLLFAGATRRGWPCRSRTSSASRSSRAAVERSEDRDVVQYIGDILPLVHLSALLAERRGNRARARRPRTRRSDSRDRVAKRAGTSGWWWTASSTRSRTRSTSCGRQPARA